MSILFDLTNEESTLTFLSKYINIEKIEILESIIKSNKDDFDEYFAEFIDDFKLDIEEFNVYDVECVILHMTTNDDECESIRRYGLVDLQKALVLDTPLNRYLKKYGVRFDIDKKIMYLNGKSIGIEYKKYTTVLTKKEENIQSIARKIYFDNQINGFFSLNDWSDYGGYVNKRPEILYNIGELIGDKIETDWIESNESYEIKFKAKVKDIEYYTFYETKEECEEDYLYSYYNLKKWFLEKSMYILWCKYKTRYAQVPEIFVFMKPTVAINWESIIDIN